MRKLLNLVIGIIITIVSIFIIFAIGLITPFLIMGCFGVLAAVIVYFIVTQAIEHLFESKK